MVTIVRSNRPVTLTPEPTAQVDGTVWVDAGDLHPDTEPAAISARQRADVRAAAARHGTDPATLSAVVVLPVWSVRRHLAALGLGPPVPRQMILASPIPFSCPGSGSR